MLKPYLLPESDLGGVTRDYLENLPQATDFLGQHYSEAGVFAQRAELVTEQFAGKRAALVEMLVAYNQSLGCSEAVGRQIQKLLDPRAVAVLCGQQAGLFTGPLYTIYKGIGAVKLAARLEKELGRPVVPVFWIAAEDHDISEANHAWVLDRENRPQQIVLEFEHGGEPVGKLPLVAEASRAVLAAFTALLPETEFAPEILAWVEEARQTSATPVEWFGRVMARLFADEGLVFFNPLLPQARKLAAPVIAKVVERRKEVQVALVNRDTALKAAGYPLQVERESDATLLMLLAEKRTSLIFRDERYTTRDGAVVYTEAELAAVVKEAPAMLSPNVLLRPLVQDTIFPTVAFITGPGETAYFAQVTALYPVLGLTPPVIYPRIGVTVVEPRLTRHLKKYQIPEHMLLTDLGSCLEQTLRRENDVDLDRLFCHLRRHLAVEYADLKEDLAKLNPQLGKLADTNLQHVYSEIRYLEDKARDEFKQKNDVTLRQFAALEQSLRPFGKLQERVYGCLPYLIKYGPNFWRQLVDQFPEQPGHYLFYVK